MHPKGLNATAGINGKIITIFLIKCYINITHLYYLLNSKINKFTLFNIPKSKP